MKKKLFWMLIEHLPSGKSWTTDKVEDHGKSWDPYKRSMQAIADGDTLIPTIEGNVTAFHGNIVKDSVITFFTEEVEEETNNS